MASRQRTQAPKKERSAKQLADLGIFMPDLDILTGDSGEDGDDDSDLESELQNLLSGKSGATKAERSKMRGVSPMDIESMAAECMKDISDVNSDDDSMLDDPDLLNELKLLAGESEEMREVAPQKKEYSPVPVPNKNIQSEKNILSMLHERLQIYNEALSHAKSMNESSKARRYTRGVKTIESLIKQAKSGQEINIEEIPPMVNIPKGIKSPETVPLESDGAAKKMSAVSDIPCFVSEEKEKKDIHEKQSRLAVLKLRKNKYKSAALQAKQSGDKTTAIEHMKNMKILDAMIQKAEENDELIDMSTVPASPQAKPKAGPIRAETQEDARQQASPMTLEAAAISAASEPQDPTLFEAPPPPKSVLEALEQRHAKFKATLSAAEAEGNSSKARRLQRIVKSYEKAIKDHKAGKQIDFDELPVPPGFAPIPVSSLESGDSGNVPSASSKTEKQPPTKKPSEVAPSIPKKPAPAPPSGNVQKRKVQRANTSSLVDKQLEFLLERQRLFREAAISSKKAGNLEEAKEYLRMSKGFDSMIEATRCGLPIDSSSIPTPPQLQMDADFVIVDRSDCTEGSDAELFDILHKDLTKQIEICKTNKEHYLKLGDVSSASKFEKLGLESQKDLTVIHHLKKIGQSPPRFHYETRMFSIVQCHNDLNDDQLEITVERGINLPGKPDELDSFVKIEFPIGNDGPQKAKTNVVWNTNNPIFQEVYTFSINRKSRTQLRQFKRQILKLGVYAKGGFFRSDTLLGTVSIKLVDLEQSCTIHDCFDLMDGRKTTGGKLECKVRIKQPLLGKQVEQVQEKWLVVGS